MAALGGVIFPITVAIAAHRERLFGIEGIVARTLVYVPLMTPFLAEARENGLRTVDGLGMLLHQAVPGFERWFGVRPTVDAALRDHIVADLPK